MSMSTAGAEARGSLHLASHNNKHGGSTVSISKCPVPPGFTQCWTGPLIPHMTTLVTIGVTRTIDTRIDMVDERSIALVILQVILNLVR